MSERTDQIKDLLLTMLFAALLAALCIAVMCGAAAAMFATLRWVAS